MFAGEALGHKAAYPAVVGWFDFEKRVVLKCLERFQIRRSADPLGSRHRAAHLWVLQHFVNRRMGRCDDQRIVLPIDEVAKRADTVIEFVGVLYEVWVGRILFCDRHIGRTIVPVGDHES